MKATEEKDLLLRDLCARLPYGVIGAVPHYDEDGEEVLLQGKITGFNKGQIKFEYLPDYTDDIGAYNWFDIDLVKLYLRPMSSMTEEEMIDFLQVPDLSQVSKKFINDFKSGNFGIMANMSNYARNMDWLNKNMFDFRGLIPKDLALSTDEFNPYKD